MGILKRIFGGTSAEAVDSSREILILEGLDTLEVVGESYCQDVLWELVGGNSGQRVRVEVIGTLNPQPDNKYDPNAIAVHIENSKVGFVAKELAAEIIEELNDLIKTNGGKVIGLRGVIAGGGDRDDGPGMLGVFLEFPAEAFGESSHAPKYAPTEFSMNSGKSDALFTDLQDDSYDLSWMGKLGNDPSKRIVGLRKVLESNQEPISRHFAFSELEELLYQYKEVFPGALEEYDEVATKHQQEISSTIKTAMIDKWGKLPNLVVHRQSAIRHTKAKNFAKALEWVENGLRDYGTDAFKEEWILDLQKRVVTLNAKIEKTKK
jgi:hypothetical protein